MADSRDAKDGPVARLRRWARSAIVQEVPAEMERCEFDCRKDHCTLGEWDTCENRLKSLRPGEK